MNTQRDKLQAWKYLVDDFLEMACFLNQEERGFLIEKISLHGAAAETISSHPSFSVSGKLISVTDKEKIGEVWLYSTEEKELKCFKLIEAPGAVKNGPYRWSNSLRQRFEKAKE